MDVMGPILVMTVVLAFLMLVGVPIGYSLGFLGTLLLLFFEGGLSKLILVPQKAYYGIASYVFICLPLFIFMSSIISESGVGSELFDVASKWLGRLPGGLAVSSIVGCAVFGAISGSSSATAAAIGGVAVREMEKRGYNRRLALGACAAGGNLGTLIPPSIPLILYGTITNTPIGPLFMGGVIPGIVLALLYSIYIIFVSVLRPGYAPPAGSVSWKERFSVLRKTWTLLVMMFFVLGGIYTGKLDPTEAAAVGVAVSILIALFVYRKMDWAILSKAIRTTVQSTAILGVILIGGMILEHAVIAVGVGPELVRFVESLQVSRWVIMALIATLFVFLGCFLNVSAMILLLVPLLFPIVKSLGFDLLWFGVFVAMVTETAHLTPPVGGNLFIIKGVTGAPLEDVIRGGIPFLILTFVMALILCLFPQLATWLPSLSRA